MWAGALGLGALLAGCGTLFSEAPPEDNLGERLGASLHDAAISSEQQRDFGAAATYYRTLLRREPGDPKASVGLSRSLRNLQRPKEAEPILRRALRRHEDDPIVLEELGKVQLAVGDPAAALDSLNRADRLAPDSWSVKSALAVTHDRLGLFEDSARYYEQALSLSPDNPSVLNNLALSRALRGDLAGGIDYLEQASNMPEAGARIAQNLALLYTLDGKLPRAERLLRDTQGPKVADDNIVYLRELAANLKSPEAVAARAGTAASGEGEPVRDSLASRVIARALAALPRAEPAPAAAEKTSPAEPEDRPAASTETDVPAKAGEAGAAGEKAAAATPREARPATAAPVAREAAVSSRPVAEDRETAQTAPVQPVSPPASPPPASSPPAPSAAGLYKVQLGSFRSESAASRFVSSMAEKHERALTDTILEIRRVELDDKGVLFRVVTNDLPDQGSADTLCRRLRQSGADCVRIPSSSVK